MGETVIRRNFVNEARDGALLATGAVVTEWWGGSRLDIAQNTVRAAGDAIVVGTDESRVSGNDIGRESEESSNDGIVVRPGVLPRPMRHLQVTNNRVVNLERHGIYLATAIASGLIKQNQIEGVGGGGIFMDLDGMAEHLVIENNQLLNVADVSAEQSRSEPLLAGIHVFRANHIDLIANTISVVGRDAALAPRLAGIQITASRHVRVTANRVANLGPAAAGLRDADGIALLGLTDFAQIADNVVERHESPPADPADNSLFRALRIGLEQRAGVTIGPVLLVPLGDAEALLTADRAFIRALLPDGSQIRGNALRSYGISPAVLVSTRGPISMSDNRAILRSDGRSPVVLATGSALILMGNYVDGGQGDHDVVRIQLGANGPFTVLGKIVSGLILINGNRLPAPLQNPMNMEMAQL
jgi:hypothetical protein